MDKREESYEQILSKVEKIAPNRFWSCIYDFVDQTIKCHKGIDELELDEKLIKVLQTIKAEDPLYQQNDAISVPKTTRLPKKEGREGEPLSIISLTEDLIIAAGEQYYMVCCKCATCALVVHAKFIRDRNTSNTIDETDDERQIQQVADMRLLSRKLNRIAEIVRMIGW